MDCSLPGSSVHGIFQARILEWIAISFSEIFFLVFHVFIYALMASFFKFWNIVIF